MPMLLIGDAAEWWCGVKHTAKAFEDVIKMLRESFCPPRPDWRISLEIVDTKQQKNQVTDCFIRKKRALFAQMKSVPEEFRQIGRLFGLLHPQIREKLARHKINSFDDGLMEACEAEHCIAYKPKDVSHSVENAVGRCSFCRKKRHELENCFNKQAQTKDAQAKVTIPVLPKPKHACYGCNAPG